MSAQFSFEQRQRALQAMGEEYFDLAIIGGGITGAGVARDAASRGLRVALVEASDFASGTSSRSSKLIHGGIRYLENLEFGLVFEALSERARLFELAPHLVHPLQFLIPIYKAGRVPAWKMGLGMMVYDALSLYEAPELHRYLDSGEVNCEFPSLRTEGLSGGFIYSDAYMDDDRLVQETLRSAHAFGAQIANYTRVQQACRENGQVTGLACEDVMTGRRFVLRARHYVSSVGPWTDRLGGLLSDQWKKRLRPSKGVHLTFQRERFPLSTAVVMAAEKRIVFAIPRHEMVIVGTTDTDFSEDPSQVRCEADDVRYLMQVLSDYFPGANLKPEDIIGAYAGVRPLIDDGAQTESKTSREHEIWTEWGNFTFVAGGKYTTYRRMAEQTVEEVLHHFSMEERARFAHSYTLEPLNPLVTESLLERARREHAIWPGASDRITAALAGRHGMEAPVILAKAQSELALSLANEEEWLWCAEALHAVDSTMCLHLSDFYFRRTPLVLARRDHGLPFAPAIAAVMAQRLGWSADRMVEEINALQKQIAWNIPSHLS